MALVDNQPQDPEVMALVDNQPQDPEVMALVDNQPQDPEVMALVDNQPQDPEVMALVDNQPQGPEEAARAAGVTAPFAPSSTASSEARATSTSPTRLTRKKNRPSPQLRSRSPGTTGQRTRSCRPWISAMSPTRWTRLKTNSRTSSMIQVSQIIDDKNK